VPATARAFADPPPPHLYLDTDVCLAYLIPSEPLHQRAGVLFSQLAIHGSTTVYVSALSWIEFVSVVTRENFRRGLPPDWRRRYRLTQWQRPSVRHAYLTDLLAIFEQMLDQFGWTEVAVTTDIRIRALALVNTYHLEAHDAVHLACAQAAGVQDLASFDAQFRAVDGLSLWNDRIYASPPASPTTFFLL
jgi:predicted nucleic acid-binding protein